MGRPQDAGGAGGAGRSGHFGEMKRQFQGEEGVRRHGRQRRPASVPPPAAASPPGPQLNRPPWRQLAAAAAFLNSSDKPTGGKLRKPSAVVKKEKAWPGARLLSSAFCNALPFYLTTCIMPQPLPPLTPYSPTPQNRIYSSAPSHQLATLHQKHWKTNGEAAVTRELLSRFCLKTVSEKEELTPKYHQADANWAATFTARRSP